MARRKPGIHVEVDTREFQRALNLFRDLTNKSDAEVIASAAIDTCFAAPGHTKKASARDLDRINPVQAGWKNIPYGTSSRAGPRMLYAIAAKKGERLSTEEAKTKWQKRKASIGYMKVHWLALAKVLIDDARFLGGRFLTKKVRSNISADLETAARKHLETELKLKKRDLRKFARFDVSVPAKVNGMMTSARDRALAKAASRMVSNAATKYVFAAKKVSSRKKR